MKKILPLYLLLILFFFTRGPLTAQSKWLFNPGGYIDGPFKEELSGGVIMAGLEYRPKTYFGLEARVKYGFYSFSRDLLPDHQGISGVYFPNGFLHYHFQSPQLGIVPRVYQDLDIFYDGLFLFAESDFSIGQVNGGIEITGETNFEKTFSEAISYYSVSIGLEYREDNAHWNKRDFMAAASAGISSWNLKKQFNRLMPDFYDGPKPLQDITLMISLTLKVPIGTK